MSIALRQDMLLVDVLEEDTSEGGIILMHTAKNDSNFETATIKAVGPGKLSKGGTLIPMTDGLIVGAKVMFTKHAGIDYQNYRIVSEQDVVCIL